MIWGIERLEREGPLEPIDCFSPRRAAVTDCWIHRKLLVTDTAIPLPQREALLSTRRLCENHRKRSFLNLISVLDGFGCKLPEDVIWTFLICPLPVGISYQHTCSFMATYFPTKNPICNCPDQIRLFPQVGLTKTKASSFIVVLYYSDMDGNMGGSKLVPTLSWAVLIALHL